MDIIPLEGNQDHALEKAQDIIKKGGLVAVPTDTVYGIIGDATNLQTIEDLYALKGRPKEKAFPIFVRDIAMARWFAYIADAKARFLERAWPGAVTVVFHHKEKLPKRLTAGNDTIAMRMPDHPFLLALLARLNVPVVQSSANISGALPARHIQEIITSLKERPHAPDCGIDSGEMHGQPSVILDLTTDKPLIMRAGIMMGKDDIDALHATLMRMCEFPPADAL